MSQLEKRNIAIALPTLDEQEWHATKEAILSGWVTQGPKVEQFQTDFAERLGVKHALATTSCTTALHLALAGLNIMPGDEVIVPAFTWIATANAVKYCGATPVFVDVLRDTFNIDPSLVADAVTNKTKAIIPVHLFGLCADTDSIRDAAPDIAIIEDAACAVGAAYKGNPAGSLGDAGCFSFHPRKIVTTGEGGMVTTNNDQLAETMNQLRNHGATVSEEQRHHGPRPYMLPDFNILGFNYRMTDIQGAVGIVQLGRLERLLAERRQWAEYYRRELADIDWLRTPTSSRDYVHGWQSFVCYVDEAIAPMPRNDIMERLQLRGISTRPGTHAVHMLGYYAETMGLKTDDFPVARDCDRYTMAIPLHNRMTAEDYSYVVQALKSI